MKIRDRVITGLVMGAVFVAAYGGGVSLAAQEDVSYTESDRVAYTAVTYEAVAASTYTVSIPATIALSSKEAVSETISVTECNLTDASLLRVSITGGINGVGQVELRYKNAEGDNNSVQETIYSTVTNSLGEPISNDLPVILEVQQGLTAASATINYSVPYKEDGSDITAGTYEGQLTFGIEAISEQ